MTAAPKKLSAAPAPLPPPTPSRMRLDNLVVGPQENPLRVLLFGPEGVGKSTFGANAPSPIFLGTENGTDRLNVSRFPAPESWEDVLEAIRVLTKEKHAFKTLVIDSADWLEPIIWAAVCKRDGKKSIEEVGGGYGKGYTAAADQWRLLISALESLMRQAQMNVITIAHSTIKRFENPQGPDYERYELMLNKQAAGILKQWHDAILFANHETFAEKDERTKRVKGVSNGARIMHTTRSAAFDAKNRYGLPEAMPLSWEEFEQAAKAGKPADVDALVEEIERKAKQLGGDVEKNTLVSLGRVSKDAVKLAQLNDWVNAKLMERQG